MEVSSIERKKLKTYYLSSKDIKNINQGSVNNDSENNNEHTDFAPIVKLFYKILKC